MDADDVTWNVTTSVRFLQKIADHHLEQACNPALAVVRDAGKHEQQTDMKGDKKCELLNSPRQCLAFSWECSAEDGQKMTTFVILAWS